MLSYRRRGALERVLKSIREQDHPAFETIVVDNGSGEQTTSWIRENHPWVRLIELPRNMGAVARNHGLREARGDFVVTLDNDVYFDSPAGLRRVVEAFQRHPRAGCLAFRVYHPKTGRLHARDWCHPRPWQEAETTEFETHYITEGASAFRREVFDRIEPYWERLWIGHEGFDLGLRLMDAGYEIWYAPDVKVWHMASLETRENWRPFYFNTRNLLLVVYRNYPLLRGMGVLLPRLAVLGFYAIRCGFLRKYLAGLADGVRELGKARAVRRKIRPETLRRVSTLRASMPGPVTRFLRHWARHEF